MKGRVGPGAYFRNTGHEAEINQAVTPPDLYVTLSLPTASACTLRTKTIKSSKTPEWNETFHFRANSKAKNILELHLYDSDILVDDKCSSILFDISTLTLGKKETKVFITDDTKKDELWVEFDMTESSEAPGQYFSNGVLLAAPLSTLEVKLNKLPPNIQSDLLLKLHGAYNENQVIPMSSLMRLTLRYYINKYLDTKIELRMTAPLSTLEVKLNKLPPNIQSDLLLKLNGAYNENQVIPMSSLMETLRYYIKKYLDTHTELRMEEDESTIFPVSPFGPTQELTVTLPMVEEILHLHLNTVDRSEEDLKVRLDFDIPAEEKEFLVKRKQVVSRALQKYLKLETPLKPTEVPTVAVVCSGGGSRAMTGMLGSIKGLQSLGLLDAVSYITSVSGSTWASASLYTDPFWSKEDLNKVIASTQKELSKNTISLLSPAQVIYYYSEMKQRQEEGHTVSFIDTWGLIIEHLIFGKKHTATLSDQKKAVSEGQNPLPIYTAVNKKKNAHGCLVPEWCEFTPFEVGFSKYGAFVPAEYFGSEYYLGHVVNKLPESRISFLLGIWSSVLSGDLVDIWRFLLQTRPFWTSNLGDNANKIEIETFPNLGTLQANHEASLLKNLLKQYPFISSVYNFLRGFFLHNLYNKCPRFITSDDTHPDAFPNKLTPADSTLHLVDSGFAINTAFSPVVQQHRHADVILCFDYSWDTDHFQNLKNTEQYCKDNNLPFPEINFSKCKSEPTQEVYVFQDEKNPDAPIVIHFPLVNVSFKNYKAPGVKRRGKEELKEGNIDVSSRSSPYTTQHLTFTSEDFQRLVDLTFYNVMNNEESISNAIKKALTKKSQPLSP